TSFSTIQGGRIQGLTRGRRSAFTTTICRKSRQHDFAAVAGPHSGRAPPSLRDTPATAQDQPNRQRLHLAEPKRCLDEAGHLLLRRAPSRCRLSRLRQRGHPALGVELEAQYFLIGLTHSSVGSRAVQVLIEVAKHRLF